MGEIDLRLECLRLAANNSQHASADAVLAAARAYLQFAREEQKGESSAAVGPPLSNV